jgi:hypothetical protein
LCGFKLTASATTALREAREAEERDRARGGDGIQHCVEGAGANAIEEEGKLEVASRRGGWSSPARSG